MRNTLSKILCIAGILLAGCNDLCDKPPAAAVDVRLGMPSGGGARTRYGGLAYDPVNEELFIGFPEAECVEVIDLTSGTKLPRITQCGIPLALVVPNNTPTPSLLVVNSRRADVLVYDLKSTMIRARLRAPSPIAGLFNTPTDPYIQCTSDDDSFKIIPIIGPPLVIGEAITLPRRPIAVGFAPSTTQRALCAIFPTDPDGGTSTFRVFRSLTGREIDSLRVDGLPRFSVLRYVDDDDCFYGVTASPPMLVRIDAAGRVTDRVACRTGASSIAFEPGSRTVAVICSSDGKHADSADDHGSIEYFRRDKSRNLRLTGSSPLPGGLNFGIEARNRHSICVVCLGTALDSARMLEFRCE
ncbi:MAG TPA: hypothetical protein VFE47_20345 [Tepidisphaeraceae bacterium]|jgi:hypothetical protein|nr:hypothetical protein [Tepidisphaeraceae bacterium]